MKCCGLQLPFLCTLAQVCMCANAVSSFQSLQSVKEIRQAKELCLQALVQVDAVVKTTWLLPAMVLRLVKKDHHDLCVDSVPMAYLSSIQVNLIIHLVHCLFITVALHVYFAVSLRSECKCTNFSINFSLYI